MEILKALKIAGKKTLFVMPEYNDNVYMSFSNVPSVNGTLLSDMNTYDIVNANVLVLTESAAKIFVRKRRERKHKNERLGMMIQIFKFQIDIQMKLSDVLIKPILSEKANSQQES